MCRRLFVDDVTCQVTHRNYTLLSDVHISEYNVFVIIENKGFHYMGRSALEYNG